VLGNFEDDTISLFQELYEKMRRALRIEHLIAASDEVPRLRHPGVVRGRIEYDRQADDPATSPEVVIDGRAFGWQEFGALLMTYEGWNFRLEILGASEEDYLERGTPALRRHGRRKR
jgi:hypothetical protein